ncbi:MAG: hemolysin activation/secretion protein, partial [Burkholderiales bacterium]
PERYYSPAAPQSGLHGADRRAPVNPYPALSPVLCASSLVLLTLVSLPGLARAQTPGSPPALSPAQAAEEALRRQEDRTRELQLHMQPRSDVLQSVAPPSGPTDLPIESPCFLVNEIKLAGPDAIRFGWLLDAAQPYLYRCVGVTGLRQVAAALDATLIELGYVTTRVSLPQQNLKDGVLTFHLHVGRVAEIKMAKADPAKSPDDAWGTWWNAFPVGRGDILNVRDLEQGVEQMKRLPSQMVATELEPGTEPDTSIVRILRRPGSFSDRVRGGVTLDNSGSKTLGAAQLSSYLSLDNPFGLNDILSLSANTNAENPDSDHRSQSLAFNYSIPWGYNTFTFSKGHNRFAQIVQGTTVQFLSSGKSESAEVRWHRLIVRTSASKAGIYAAAATRRAESFLDDVELIVQRRRTTSFESGVTYKQLVGQAALDFELGYRRGMPWREAQEDLPTAAEGGATLRPGIWVLSAGYNQPFNIGGAPLQYTATVRAQHTRDVTLSVDQIGIGNRFSVRGFDGDAVLLAESGYFLRNDLSTPVKLVDGIDSAAFIGIDLGRVWGPSDINLVGAKLAGAAAGLRGKWKSLQFDLSLATPLYKPAGFKTDRWNPYLSVTYAF